MIKAFCLFISLVLFINTYSQPKRSWIRKGYEPGYIITNNNDTLYGYLKDRTSPPFQKLYNNVRVKSHERGVTGGYSPNEINKYCIKNQCFKSMWYKEESFFLNFDYYALEGEGEKRFMKVIVDGYISLYHKEYIDGEDGYVSYIPYFKRGDEYVLQRATQGIFGLKKKQVSLYFKDCPALVQKINENEITSPSEVAYFYNEWKKKND